MCLIRANVPLSLSLGAMECQLKIAGLCCIRSTTYTTTYTKTSTAYYTYPTLYSQAANTGLIKYINKYIYPVFYYAQG